MEKMMSYVKTYFSVVAAGAFTLLPVNKINSVMLDVCSWNLEDFNNLSGQLL